MSGTMSKYIIEDEDVQCFYPDVGHCPIKCISRSYAHLFLRFQDLEQSIREMKNTLDTVMDYIIHKNKSSSSSDSDGVRDKKKAKKAKTNKSRNVSRSGSDEPNIDQDLIDAQATLERDFTQLLTWKDSDDEGGKPKKPKRCQVISCLKSKSSTSSNDGDTSELETSDDQHPGIVSEAGEIVRKVSKVIDDMAKVVDELQVTAGMAVEVTADAAELQNDNAVNGSQSEVDEEEEEEEENSESEFIGDFIALYNEMNEVD